MDLKNKTLVLFGDSIMYGSGNGGYGVGEYLVKDLGVRLKKYCVGGARVGFNEGKNWLVDQIKIAIEEGVTPDCIVFDGFTNDCFRTDGVNFDVPLGDIKPDVPDIFKISETDDFSTCFESAVLAFEKYFPSAKVVFVRPHKMGRREAEAQKLYGDRAAEICEKHSIAVADVYNLSGMDTFLDEHRDKYTADTYGWGKGDSTHPNAAGYEKFYMPLIENTIKEL